jgi:hypothetical protein
VSLKIRNARPEDETAVVALWQSCGLVASYNDPAADFRFALAGACSDVLVGEDESGQITGSVMIGHDGHRLAFERPKRVRAVQEHEGKLWVFVDDIEAGVPMEQVEVIEKGVGASALGQPPRLSIPRREDVEPEDKSVRKSRFALAEGDVVVTFPENLSADSVEDLDGFWQVFIKKARREAGSKQ